MSNVTKFYPKGAAASPDNVLEQAVGVYDNVLIIGWDKNGVLDVRSDLGMNKAEANFLVDQFKHDMMNGNFDAVED